MSVVDVGCGRGAWLRAFRENGVEVIAGMDGDHIATSKLLIEPLSFRCVDLTKPLRSTEKYDLAVCLEVVEHLPSTAGRSLIASLTSVAPLVLFSAAIPGQRGTGHINEQWPPYWQSIFAGHGYVRLDPIR